MDNLSLQEEPFGRLNLDELEEMGGSYYYYFDSGDVLAKLLELGINGSSILSCITLVYVIVKFDYLQTRTNMYILHYAIAIGTFQLLIPAYELFLYLEIYFFSNGPIICAIYRIDGTMISLSFVFTLALALDWLVVSLDVSWLEKYGQIQKYIISLIYLGHLVLYIDIVISCFGLERVFAEGPNILVYLIMGVIIILINCLRFKKPTEASNKHKYALTISTYIMINWLPMFPIYFFFVYFMEYDSFIYNTFQYLLLNVTKLMILAVPIVSAFWLNNLNDDFSKAYKVVFRHKHDYNQQNLDDDDESRLIQNERNQS